jgi:hypothetical protein
LGWSTCCESFRLRDWSRRILDHATSSYPRADWKRCWYRSHACDIRRCVIDPTFLAGIVSYRENSHPAPMKGSIMRHRNTPFSIRRLLFGAVFAGLFASLGSLVPAQVASAQTTGPIVRLEGPDRVAPGGSLTLTVDVDLSSLRGRQILVVLRPSSVRTLSESIVCRLRGTNFNVGPGIYDSQPLNHMLDADGFDRCYVNIRMTVAGGLAAPVSVTATATLTDGATLWQHGQASKTVRVSSPLFKY